MYADFLELACITSDYFPITNQETYEPYQEKTCHLHMRKQGPGAQFEGDLGEILALGAEISHYIGLREKWESP